MRALSENALIVVIRAQQDDGDDIAPPDEARLHPDLRPILKRCTCVRHRQPFAVATTCAGLAVIDFMARRVPCGEGLVSVKTTRPAEVALGHRGAGLVRQPQAGSLP